jgi:hypothetical protein
VFGIDRQQRRLMADDFAHEDRARRDETFFVGERRRASLPHGGKGRLQPGGADDRRHDPIGGPHCGLDHSPLAGTNFDAGAGQAVAKFRIAALVSERDKFWSML